MKRYLQRELETRIGRALVAGDAHDGATITVDAGPDGLNVKVENPVEEEAEA